MLPQQNSTGIVAVLALGLVCGWFMFTGQISMSDAEVGGAALVLVLLLAARLAVMRFAQFRPRPAWLAQAVTLPWQLLHDTVIVIGILWRRLARGERSTGRFAVAPFPG